MIVSLSLVRAGEMGATHMHNKYRDVIGLAVATGIALCLCLLASGCSTLFQRTIRVESAAVDEVRSIGRVVAATMEDPIYGNTIQVNEVLVLDLGASSFDESMKAARTSLEKQGWAFDREAPDYIRMESTRWDDTSLTIEPYDDVSGYSDDVRQRVDGVQSTDHGKYVLLVIRPVSP